MEEAAIIRALQAGDRSALEEAVVRYTHYLTAVAARAMGPDPGREDLEEIVSDTFLSLWRFRANLDPERPLRPWLAVAARNLAVSRLRQRKETQEIPETLPDSRPGPEELAIFGEQYADTLRRMQTELSALERTVLMAGLEGRTPAQTARELGLPAKNVANALARARRKLRGAPTT